MHINIQRRYIHIWRFLCKMKAFVLCIGISIMEIRRSWDRAEISLAMIKNPTQIVGKIFCVELQKVWGRWGIFGKKHLLKLWYDFTESWKIPNSTK